MCEFQSIFKRLHANLDKRTVIEKLKFTSPWIHVIQYLNIEVIIGIFYEKELQKI